MEKMEAGDAPKFSFDVYGELRFDQRLYVPQHEEATWECEDDIHARYLHLFAYR